LEDYSFQMCKDGHRHCGDKTTVVRREDATVAIVADGIGSGVPANLAATLVTEYLLGLLKDGFSTTEAAKACLRALRSARLNRGPWAAFSVVRVSTDGRAHVVSYESPFPLLLTQSGPEEMEYAPRYWEGEVAYEAQTYVRTNEALLVFTDGVTQAGLGRGLPKGWGESGVLKYLNESGLNRPELACEIPPAVVRQAASLNGNRPSDDITVLALFARRPRVLHVLTGPPARREDTEKVLSAFAAVEGTKVVCGGTTTLLLAKHMGVEPRVHPGQYGAPAYYELQGVALACEGTVTLNRVNNIFDEPELASEAGYGASRLLELLSASDEIHFWVGQATNAAHLTTLRPAGVLSRNEVVASLAEKLKRAGKLTVIKKM